MQAINTDFVLRLSSQIDHAKVEYKKIVDFIETLDPKEEEYFALACNLREVHWEKFRLLKDLLCEYIQAA